MKTYSNVDECTKVICPICEKKSSNSLRGLAVHTNKMHGVNSKELYDIINPGAKKTCGCGAKLKYAGLEDGYGIACGKCRHKEAMAGSDPWNKGLTKENDERLRNVSNKLKEHYAVHTHHATGKTKQNDAGVRKKAEKVSKALKEFYRHNDHWVKGRTKETCDIIKAKSEKSGKTQRGRKFSEKHLKALRESHQERKISHDVVVQRFDKSGFTLLKGQEREGYGHALLVECKECGHINKKTVHSVWYCGSTCDACDPSYVGKSAWQKEIYDYVNDLVNVNVVLNDRHALSGLEIDIYIPSVKFGIECNGLYWHSEKPGRYTKGHAEEKRVLAEENGIELWTLFEDEWESKRDIIKSMISHKLKKGITSIHGRKCKIKHVKAIELRDFINDSHIDGYVRARHGLAMIHNGEVVGACTLRVKRGSKGTLEIARLCFKKFHHVNGGVSKLISHAAKLASKLGAKELFTYADNRLGGACYTNTMLKKDGNTVMRWWWTDCLVRYDRFKYRADKSAGLTEKEVARRNGVWKIYGCTNSRYRLAIQHKSS